MTFAKAMTPAFLLLLTLPLFLSLPACSRDAAPKTGTAAGPHEKSDGHEHRAEAGTVRVTAETQKAAGIEARQAVRQPAAGSLSATAVIELNADRLSRVGPRTAGRISRIMVSQGSRVRAGEALAYFDSPELGAVWAELVKAKGRVELTRRTVVREETLFAKRISPEKDVLKARQELAEAEADLRLARQRLALLGSPAKQTENETTEARHPLIPLTSPISGIVIEKNVSQGEVVGPEKTLFTVADLSTLWLLIDVYERDLAQVREGRAVQVVATAFPDNPFKGKISYVGDVVDEKTRTVKARVSVVNEKGLLKPGMFATVTIDTAGGRAEQLILVPDEAVFFEGTERHVFVQTGPDSFVKREVRAGRVFGRLIELTGGVREGELLVVKGVFPLKAELKKEALGDEH